MDQHLSRQAQQSLIDAVPLLRTHWTNALNVAGAAASVAVVRDIRLAQARRDDLFHVLRCILASPIFDASMPDPYTELNRALSKVGLSHYAPADVATLPAMEHDFAVLVLALADLEGAPPERLANYYLTPWRHRDLDKSRDAVLAFEAILRLNKVETAYDYFGRFLLTTKE